MKFKEWLQENKEPSQSGPILPSAIDDERWEKAGLRPTLVISGMKKKQKKQCKK